MQSTIKSFHVEQHIKGYENQTIYVSEKQHGDITVPMQIGSDDTYIVSNCKSCTIYVLQISGSARFEKLVDCKVYVAPIKRAVYVDSCLNTEFHLASHQARIHSSECCNFNLYTKTSPIIENCKNVRFGPYNFSYAEKGEHFIKAVFDSPNNNWNDVKDFNWIKAQASPNWSVIPEQERKKVEI